MSIDIAQLETLLLAIAVLFIGAFVIKRVDFLREYNICDPLRELEPFPWHGILTV